MWLQMVGFEVSCASTGREALDLVDRQPFDVMLCDIGLPDIDGVEVVRQVRNKSSVPAIALTALRPPRDAADEVRLLFRDWLQKPAPLDDLETAIRRAIIPVASPGAPQDHYPPAQPIA